MNNRNGAELWAHMDRDTLRTQTLSEHSEQVAAHCAASCAEIGLCRLGRLTGLLHDSGKGAAAFQEYLRHGDPAQKGSVNHSACGARYVYENWGLGTTAAGLAAQLAATAICSHHSGLPDVTGTTGEDNLIRRAYPERETDYEETLSRYFESCSSPGELNALFEDAQREVQQLCRKISGSCDTLPAGSRNHQTWFMLGLAQRYLLSCLIDADRYDAYLFEADVAQTRGWDLPALWEELTARLETALNVLPARRPLDLKRREISEACRRFSVHGSGVYQLVVPTGGGKTFGSLRYALHCAAKHQKERIVYVAPYRSILEQNAEEIRQALRRDEVILEHHSDIVDDSEAYQLLTQRWDAPLILTTTVQFLNALFSGQKSAIRRMHSLTNTIIILDEVQAIPVKCTYLFNAAVNFLADVCNCAVVLCTATQPVLAETAFPVHLGSPAQMVQGGAENALIFRRTRVVDKTAEGPFSADRLAEFVLHQLENCQNLLVILNTKKAAATLYEALQERMRLWPEQTRIPLYYLSTGLCPAHRISSFREIRERLASVTPGQNRLLCVSTQLIEAGVDLSFQCVIRSLAGIDSIAQAAGRCNRHGERACGDVFIFKSADENLASLPDICKGQEAAQHVLEDERHAPRPLGDDLLSPQTIRRYFRYYYTLQEQQLGYPVGPKQEPKLFADTSLFDLLSLNSLGRLACREQERPLPAHALHQAFETAGNRFEVIEKNGADVLVPFEDGKALITQLYRRPGVKELAAILRQAQRFSVHLYEREYRMLYAQGALDTLPDAGIVILKEGFYHIETGLQTRRGMLESLIE